MSLIPYALTRPFLFGLDAEAAHDLTMDMLARGQGTPLQWAWCNETVHDPIELAGLQFPNRVGLAAGLDKNARCIDALGAMGFGFVEVGTVTPKGQPGNPKPRMFRLPEARALINRLGFNNDGLEAFLRNVQQAKFRRQQKHPMLLGLNIGKNATTPIEDATRDYLTCLDGVYPHADYVTVNISSPNTQNLRALQSDAALDGLLGAIAERREQLAQKHTRTDGKQRRVPIFVKIAPDLSPAELEEIAEVAISASSHSSAETVSPSRARLVTPYSAMPQGTIPPKWLRSGSRLTEKPCIVTQRRMRTPIAPIFASRPSMSCVQMPMRPSRRKLSTPRSARV